MTDVQALVNESYRAFNARDEETIRSIYTRDALWDGSHFPGFPGETQYIGPEGILAFIDDWWGAWEDFVTTPKEIVEAPNGIFIHGHMHARGRGGLKLEVDLGQVAHVSSDGRISAVYNYADVEEARRDAGL